MDYPRRLLQQTGLISLPFDPERKHPLQQRLHMPCGHYQERSPSRRAFAGGYRHTAFIMEHSHPGRYAGAWRAREGWCAERSLYPITVPINEVLNFLASLFQQQHPSYQTVAVSKCAILQTHDPARSVSLGALSIFMHMTGIFRQDPPKPKLYTSWKVQDVLSYIREQKSVEKLSLKELRHKLILLLVLTSAAGPHEQYCSPSDRGIDGLDTRYTREVHSLLFLPTLYCHSYIVAEF